MTEPEREAARAPDLRWLATASFVCGVLSLGVWLLIIVHSRWIPIGVRVAAFGIALTALVLGWISMPKTERLSRERVMSALGAVTGFAMLFWLPLTMIDSGRMLARRTQCASNLRTLGHVLSMYADDHGGRYPSRLDLLVTEIELSTDVFVCPASDDTKATGPTTQAVVAQFNTPGYCSYVYVGTGLTKATATVQTVVAYESMKNHEKEGMNVLYGDGTVQWVARAEAEHIISELKAGRNPPATRPAK